MDLKTEILRLAETQPQLRKHLVPILRKNADDGYKVRPSWKGNVALSVSYGIDITQSKMLGKSQYNNYGAGSYWATIEAPAWIKIGDKKTSFTVTYQAQLLDPTYDPGLHYGAQIWETTTLPPLLKEVFAAALRESGSAPVGSVIFKDR